MSKKITLEEFIKKAKDIHGDKYDYSESEYINYRTNIKIICPKHGPFYTTPNAHIGNKRGCRFCGYEKLSKAQKLTKDAFIKKAKVIWGDKFDYSKVNYINNSTKICILDKNGNEFWQTPCNHLYGFDCTINKIDTNLFIEKSTKLHNNKYNYSKVEYKNAKTKVCIICPEHGEFWQLPHTHLNGGGCCKCGNKKRRKSLSSTTEEFIKKAKEVHGDKYDYSKVEYKNNHSRVCIICPEHGEFWQLPSNHLKGNGCSMCTCNKLKTNKEFISESCKIHGNKYDYSKVEYKNNHSRVCIICPEHGEFWQLPLNHLKGQGCPICAKLFRKKETELYNMLTQVYPNECIIHSYYNANILGKQEIDIYFPQYNIGIEFQGEQHFAPIDFGGYGKTTANMIFEENKLRDIKKRNICLLNNITLLYYSNVNEDFFLGEKIYHNYGDLIEKINSIIKKESDK